jgi:hypothetical protein
METQRKCARCSVRAGTNGLCAVHSRRRLTMLRAAQRRREGRRAYQERMVLLAGRCATGDWEVSSHG